MTFRILFNSFAENPWSWASAIGSSQNLQFMLSRLAWTCIGSLQSKLKKKNRKPFEIGLIVGILDQLIKSPVYYHLSSQVFALPIFFSRYFKRYKKIQTQYQRLLSRPLRISAKNISMNEWKYNRAVCCLGPTSLHIPYVVAHASAV